MLARSYSVMFGCVVQIRSGWERRDQRQVLSIGMAQSHGASGGQWVKRQRTIISPTASTPLHSSQIPSSARTASRKQSQRDDRCQKLRKHPRGSQSRQASPTEFQPETRSNCQDLTTVKKLLEIPCVPKLQSAYISQLPGITIRGRYFTVAGRMEDTHECPMVLVIVHWALLGRSWGLLAGDRTLSVAGRHMWKR